MKHHITLTIDTDALHHMPARDLATAWHVAQANPADITTPGPGKLVEVIGREIIHRWLIATPPELWHHHGAQHLHFPLAACGRWINGRWYHHSELPHQD